MQLKCNLAFTALLFSQSAVTAAPQPTPELQALDDALPGDLINDPTRIDWTVYGPGMKKRTIRNAAIPGGGAALQITSPKPGLQPYEITAEVPITTDIGAVTELTVAFYARTVKADTSDKLGVMNVRIQQKIPPYSGFGDRRVAPDGNWQMYEVKMRSDIAIANGEAIVAFQLSGAAQVIEIGQTFVLRATRLP